MAGVTDAVAVVLLVFFVTGIIVAVMVLGRLGYQT